jgi:anaerobic ribonucleoside-triphosphate reductase activating protein
MLNGDGLRVVLWVAGCTHHCKNCQNPETWDINGGIPFDADAKDELFEALDKPHISGITFSGGDPLHPQHREEVLALAKEIKEKFPQKTVWLYTGFLWEEVHDNPSIKYLDVLVDGEFMEDLKDVNLPWVGSSNQRVINVQETLKQNVVCVI